MLNFREELNKIKQNKLQSKELQGKVEEILREILRYMESISFEQLNKGTEIEFFIGCGDFKTIIISVKNSDNRDSLHNETFSDRDDAIKTAKLIEEYFIKEKYKIERSKSSPPSFTVKIEV